MKVLVINSGSSSIKYRLFDMRTVTALASGVLERIGESDSRASYQLHRDDGLDEEAVDDFFIKNHQQGLKWIADWLAKTGAISGDNNLAGIGHRVAHGGADFSEPTIIDEQVMNAIRLQIPLAPLHNPANLSGIEVTMAEWPDTPQVAIFDTAFHHTIPAHAHLYALPLELAQSHAIRRYGFHGTSHKYVAEQAARLLDKPFDEVNLIVLHLGNGASATAIHNGQSVDTSMGLTPLEGLMMGTRCGDIDPGVLLYLARNVGMSVEKIDSLLNNESGLKGICGVNDMREVLRREQAGDQQAALAAEMYTYRIKKYIGAYAAVLPQVDAIVFTAGIGEHSAEIRARACSNLGHLGIHFDADKNAAKEQSSFAIHSDQSEVKIFVVPTDEELAMAKQTLLCLNSN